MKITLEFDTESESEFNLHKTYVKAEDMSMALWDITQALRRVRKYESEGFSEETYNQVEKLENEVWEIINEYGLNKIVNG